MICGVRDADRSATEFKVPAYHTALSDTVAKLLARDPPDLLFEAICLAASSTPLPRTSSTATSSRASPAANGRSSRHRHAAAAAASNGSRHHPAAATSGRRTRSGSRRASPLFGPQQTNGHGGGGGRNNGHGNVRRLSGSKRTRTPTNGASMFHHKSPKLSPNASPGFRTRRNAAPARGSPHFPRPRDVANSSSSSSSRSSCSPMSEFTNSIGSFRISSPVNRPHSTSPHSSPFRVPRNTRSSNGALSHSHHQHQQQQHSRRNGNNAHHRRTASGGSGSAGGKLAVPPPSPPVVPAVHATTLLTAPKSAVHAPRASPGLRALGRVADSKSAFAFARGSPLWAPRSAPLLPMSNGRDGPHRDLEAFQLGAAALSVAAATARGGGEAGAAGSSSSSSSSALSAAERSRKALEDKSRFSRSCGILSALRTYSSK